MGTGLRTTRRVSTSKNTELRRGAHAGVFKTFAGVCLATISLDAFSAQLSEVVGGSALQRSTGGTVQTVCGQFVSPTGPGFDDTRDDLDLQMRLRDRCREMVHTNNRLQGEDQAIAFDLGIDQTQLNSALQNVAGEEIAAAGSMATESAIGQGDVVSTRFAAILSSVSKLQLSALNMGGATGIMLATTDHLGGQGGNAADSDLASEIPLGFFVNTFGGAAEKDVTPGEDGFDSDATGIAVGGEYRVKSNLVVGGSFSYQNNEADFISDNNVAGGGLDSEQTSFSGYAIFFTETTYVDIVAGFGTGTYDLQRRVVIADADGDPTTNTFDQTAVAETDSESRSLSFGVGREFVKGRFAIAPFGRMSYLNLDLDAYEESGADELDLRVDSQEIKSITLSAGARLVGTFSTGRAVVLPQLSFEFVHEIRDGVRQIVSSYVHDPRSNPLTLLTDKADKNYMIAGFGASAVFANRMQVFGEVRSLIALEDINQTLLSAGLRYEF